MFNLVAEVMATLMRKAVDQGKVRGVLTHLLPEGITHIQYAVDTILMVEGDDGSITNMKFILYCFEWVSGLKINYHKGEAYVFGLEEVDKTRITNMLNCKLGELPMKYLGIPISDCKLGRGAFVGVAEKVAKRVPPWKRNHMSSGARLILSNSCLSSLPTYTMRFYLLPQDTHRKMDSVRSRFFWRGAEENFKYHMMRWEAVCRPKCFADLGLVNTQVFNECLIPKWIWKIYNKKGSLWVRLLTVKYMRRGDFYISRENNGSRFWKSLHKVKHLFK
jgi:hypothetical protein